MNIRLPGFDYTRPYYYMVTLHRLDGLAAFSAIDETGVVENAITRAFHAAIKNFHLQWYVIEPIWCYVIMPDHIHLLIKLAEGEKRVALGTVVHQLMRAMAREPTKAELYTRCHEMGDLIGRPDGAGRRNTGIDIARRRNQPGGVGRQVKEVQG